VKSTPFLSVRGVAPQSLKPSRGALPTGRSPVSRAFRIPKMPHVPLRALKRSTVRYITRAQWLLYALGATAGAPLRAFTPSPVLAASVALLAVMTYVISRNATLLCVTFRSHFGSRHFGSDSPVNPGVLCFCA
jgi:hypothetical protein